MSFPRTLTLRETRTWFQLVLLIPFSMTISDTLVQYQPVERRWGWYAIKQRNQTKPNQRRWTLPSFSFIAQKDIVLFHTDEDKVYKNKA